MDNGKPEDKLEELEQIEGNYYKVDFFVFFALALFTAWVILTEKSIGWAVFLGIMAALFLIRGFRNWKRKATEPSRTDQGPAAGMQNGQSTE